MTKQQQEPVTEEPQVDTPVPEQEAQPEITITLNDLRNAVALLGMAQKRGAFEMEELEALTITYKAFTAFIKHHDEINKGQQS